MKCSTLVNGRPVAGALSKFLTVVAILFCFAFSAASPASAKVREEGGHDLGGGSAYEAEFKLLGKRLAGDLRAAAIPEERLAFSLDSLDEAVAQAAVFGSDDPPSEIRIEGLRRDAVNSLASRAIVFSNVIWSHLSQTQKRSLVLHEYLRFTLDLNGELVNDSRKEYSSSALALLDAMPNLAASNSAASGDERGEGSSFCSLTSPHFSSRIYWRMAPRPADRNEALRLLRKECYAEMGKDSERCGERAHAYCEPPLSSLDAQGFGYECRIRRTPMVRMFAFDQFVARGLTELEAKMKSLAACNRKASTPWLTCQEGRPDIGDITCRALRADE
jgi:hypothetical protein